MCFTDLPQGFPSSDTRRQYCKFSCRHICMHLLNSFSVYLIFLFYGFFFFKICHVRDSITMSVILTVTFFFLILHLAFCKLGIFWETHLFSFASVGSLHFPHSLLYLEFSAASQLEQSITKEDC